MTRRNRWKQPRGVQDESHFGRNVDKGSQKRVQESKRGQADADAVNDQRSDKVLHDRAAAAPGDGQSFDELREVIANENDVGTPPRNVGTSSHRDSRSEEHTS